RVPSTRACRSASSVKLRSEASTKRLICCVSIAILPVRVAIASSRRSMRSSGVMDADVPPRCSRCHRGRGIEEGHGKAPTARGAPGAGAAPGGGRRAGAAAGRGADGSERAAEDASDRVLGGVTVSIEDFWRTAQPDEAGCWIWQGRTHRGYGYLSWQGQHWRAHGLAYALTYGPIPPEVCVCHRCDVSACVNPQHLWLGSAAENRLDCVAKQRQARGARHGAYTLPSSRRVGECNGRARVTAAEIAEMRARYQPNDRRGGATTVRLAREFGGSQAQCWRNVHGQAWRH